jgi:hypothetical protein
MSQAMVIAGHGFKTVVSCWLGTGGKFGFVEMRTVELASTAVATLSMVIEWNGCNLKIGRPKDYVEPQVLLSNAKAGASAAKPAIPGQKATLPSHPVKISAASAAVDSVIMGIKFSMDECDESGLEEIAASLYAFILIHTKGASDQRAINVGGLGDWYKLHPNMKAILKQVEGGVRSLCCTYCDILFIDFSTSDKGSTVPRLFYALKIPKKACNEINSNVVDVLRCMSEDDPILAKQMKDMAPAVRELPVEKAQKAPYAPEPLPVNTAVKSSARFGALCDSSDEEDDRQELERERKEKEKKAREEKSRKNKEEREKNEREERERHRREVEKREMEEYERKASELLRESEQEEKKKDRAERQKREKGERAAAAAAAEAAAAEEEEARSKGFSKGFLSNTVKFNIGPADKDKQAAEKSRRAVPVTSPPSVKGKILAEREDKKAKIEPVADLQNFGNVSFFNLREFSEEDGKAHLTHLLCRYQPFMRTVSAFDEKSQVGVIWGSLRWNSDRSRTPAMPVYFTDPVAKEEVGVGEAAMGRLFFPGDLVFVVTAEMAPPDSAFQKVFAYLAADVIGSVTKRTAKEAPTRYLVRMLATSDETEVHVNRLLRYDALGDATAIPWDEDICLRPRVVNKPRVGDTGILAGTARYFDIMSVG